MANKEVNDLTVAGALTGAELIHIVQSGDSRKVTLQDVVDELVVIDIEGAIVALGSPPGVVDLDDTMPVVVDGDAYEVPLSGLLKLFNVYDAQTAAFSVVAADDKKTFNVSGVSAFTVSLLAAATAGAGFMVMFRNTGTTSITLDPNGAELIDGLASVVLAARTSCILVCTGTEWITLFLSQSDSYDSTLGRMVTLLNNGVFGLGAATTQLLADLDDTTPLTSWYRLTSGGTTAGTWPSGVTATSAILHVERFSSTAFSETLIMMAGTFIDCVYKRRYSSSAFSTWKMVSSPSHGIDDLDTRLDTLEAGTVRSTKTADYTLVNGDLDGKHIIYFNSASAIVCNVPSGLTAKEGVVLIQDGVGTLTVVAGVGVTIKATASDLSLRAQNSSATLLPRTSADDYNLIGDME